jgi:para-nitrobenzyl esterase
VQRNIPAFGGDPSRVMIMGESAGAVSVCALLASPKAAGLFHAAVMQSGGCAARRLEEAEAFGRKFARQAGCAEDTAACLRRLTPEQLLNVLPIEVSVAADTGDYGSVIDGEVQPQAPLAAIRAGRHNRVPAIVGANADETSRSVPPIFDEAQYAAAVTRQFGPLAPLVLRQYPAADYDSPRSAYVALTTDARFVCTSRRTARSLAESQSQPVFRYFFTFVPENASPALRRAGTWHGLDVFYLFETLDGVGGYQSGARDEEVAHAFQDYWSQLAAAGDPNRAGLPFWPRYAADDPYLELNAPPRSGTGVRSEACDFWDRLSEAMAAPGR